MRGINGSLRSARLSFYRAVGDWRLANETLRDCVAMGIAASAITRSGEANRGGRTAQCRAEQLQGWIYRLPTMAEMHASCLSTTGETRTSCFIVYFSLVPAIQTRWLLQKAPIHRSAFGICACNHSSGKRGSIMSCAKQTRLTFGLISTNDSMKRPRLQNWSRSMREIADFMLFGNCARPQAENGLA